MLSAGIAPTLDQPTLDYFLRVWQENRPRLFHRLARLTRRYDIAEDLLQDVFVSVYERLPFIDTTNVDRYLMRSATNAALTYRLQPEHLEYTEDGAVSEVTPYDALVRREQQERYDRVLRAMHRLTPKQQEALNAYLCGDPRSTAAARLGISVRTLRARQDLALAALRHRLRGLRQS